MLFLLSAATYGCIWFQRPKDSSVLFHSLFVSFLHGTLTSLWGARVLWMGVYPSFWCSALFAHSLGYFLFDFIREGFLAPCPNHVSHWAFLVHHFLGSTTLWLLGQQQEASRLLLIILWLAEITNPLQNLYETFLLLDAQSKTTKNLGIAHERWFLLIRGIVLPCSIVYVLWHDVKVRPILYGIHGLDLLLFQLGSWIWIWYRGVHPI